MNKRMIRALSLLSLLLLPALAVLRPLVVEAQAPAQVGALATTFTYLPIIIRGCSPTSQSYAQSIAQQWDTDDPVRPAYNHADKNLALRGYSSVSQPQTFINYGSDDPTQPPQIATMFNPNRVPTFSNTYRANNWNWATSPNPGTPGAPITSPPVTVLGLTTFITDTLHVPSSGYDIGEGKEVIVMFADQDSITFKYTRQDSVAPNGYTLHVDNICTDPNLLSLYNQLDAPGGPRYIPNGGQFGNYWYNLPVLPAGQPFGTARDTEIRVAIVDSGAFQDPRSCNEWWQIRPNSPYSCP